MLMNKKGYQLKDYFPIAMIFIIAIIGISIGAEVVEDLRDGYTNSDNIEYNISQDGADSLGELGSWFPTLALIFAAAIVIGILVYFILYSWRSI